MAKFIDDSGLQRVWSKIKTLLSQKADKTHSHTKNQISDFPTKVSAFTNDAGYKTTDNNTTYSLSKSGSTITLTGSDGKTTSVTDSDTNTTYESKTAASGGTAVSLVTTGEKYTWNNKSSLALGTTATTAAKGNHTHTATIAESTGTNELTLKHGTKYALTAGGDTFVFTMPTDNNTVYTHPSSHPASMITGLATVATSGKYSDLSGLPTIPTVPSSLKNPNAIGIKVNSESSAFVTYDGSAAKTITIKPSTTNGAFTISDGTTTKTIQLAGKFTDTTYNLGSFGITATAAELNYCDGVTSNIQTQLDGKASSSHTHNYAASSSAGGAATNVNVTENLPSGMSYLPVLSAKSGSTGVKATPNLYAYSGSGYVYFNVGSSNFTGGLTLHCNNSYYANIATATLSANRNITIPNKDGTVALTSDIPTIYSWAKASSKPSYTASEVGAVAASLVDSTQTFNDTTKNNIPTKGAVASYAVSTFATKANLNSLDTRVTALENSSGGSGLTEGGSLNSATIGDFYCRYINDASSTSRYVTTSDVISVVNCFSYLGGTSETIEIRYGEFYRVDAAYLYVDGTSLDEYIADAVACLMEGTLVTMADGSKKPIEDVKEGELLKSIDLETGEETTAVCLGNRVGDVKDYYYCLMFDNGMRAKTNWTHDIYNATKGTWTNTDQELELDDEIVTEEGTKTKFIGRLEAIGTPNGRKARFYDLISSNNCYYADGVLFSHTPTKQSGWVNRHSKDAPTELTNLITSYKNETHRETDLMQKDEYVNQYLDTMHDMFQKESKLRKLKDNLSRTDYVTLKLSEGIEITPTMQEVIDSRKEWRKLYNEYEVELSGIYKKANDLKVKYSDMGEDVLLSTMELRKKFFDESCKKGNENLERFKEYYRNNENFEVNY